MGALTAIFKLGAAVVGTLVLTIMAACCMGVNPFMPQAWWQVSLGLAGLCFFVGLLVLLFARNSRAAMAMLVVGFAIPLAVLAVSLVLLLPLIVVANPEVALIVCALAGIAVLVMLQLRYNLLQSLDLWSQSLTGAVEVTEVPLSYLETGMASEAEVPKSALAPLHQMRQILRAVVAADTPIGLRLVRERGHTRLFFLTWAADALTLDHQLAQLHHALKAQLPTFTFVRHSSVPTPSVGPEMTGVATTLTGEPLLPLDVRRPRVDPLTVVAETLHDLDAEGMVQLFASPAEPSVLARWWLGRRLRTKVKDAQQTVALPKHIALTPQQQTLTLVDEAAAADVQRLQQRLQRLHHHHLCQVQVTATCWHRHPETAEADARSLLESFKGALLPADPQRDLTVGVRGLLAGTRAFRRLLRGNPTGPTTQLTPEEAALFFVLPRANLGIPVIERHAFYAATDTKTPTANASDLELSPAQPLALPGSSIFTTAARATSPAPRATNMRTPVLVGSLLQLGQPETSQLTIPLDTCATHVGIWGQTGSGKTTTCLSLVYQLAQRGVIPIILVPDKPADWRPLLDAIPNMRLFTAGNEQVAPLRLNPFQVPTGASVNRHIGGVTSAFVTAWPTEGILKEHVENVIETAYTRCGWDRATNTPGRPVLLSDLFNALQEVYARDIQYSDRLKQDFWGALAARFTTLLRNPVLANMYNTSSGLTIDELLRHPTIIELRDLAPDQRALLTALLVVGIANYLEGQATLHDQPPQGLRYVLVLEEAHAFLRNVGDTRGVFDGHYAQQEAITNIVNLLRQARGHGCAVMFCDQLPTSMAPEAVKLPGITIIHYLNDPQERTLVGRQANCTDAQLRHIGGMHPGEAIIHLPTYSQPVNVQVHPLSHHLPAPLPKRTWTDARVAVYMRTVYAAAPHLYVHEPVPALPTTPTEVVSEPVSPAMDPALAAQLLFTTRSPKFVTTYASLLDDALKGDPSRAARYLVAVTREVLGERPDLDRYTHYLLDYLATTVHTPRHAGLRDPLHFALNDALTNHPRVPHAP